MGTYTIGIDVGGTKIAYGLFDDAFNIVDKRVTKTNLEQTPVEMIDEISDIAKDMMLNNKLDKSDIKGVGVGWPCYVLYEEGYIITTTNLPKMRNAPVKQMLFDRLGVRIEVDNDANVSAVAEHRFGAGKGSTNMVYATVSTGVGGGIIINNQLFRGDFGTAGEIGHMIVTEHGLHCNCGNIGCVMGNASGNKIIEYIQERIDKGESTTIMDYVREEETLSGVHLGLAARDGDALALKAIGRMAKYLGIMFANLFQILGIKTFVIGGSVMKLGDILYDEINRQFVELTPLSKKYDIKIVPSVLSDDVALIGAALLIS